MPSTDEEPSEITELLETLWVLRDYLGEMTLIGGWVPELYRRYGDVDTWRSQLSRTREADILVPLTVPRGTRDTIADVLRSAGFRPLHNERIAAVWLQDSGRGAKLEFLTGRSMPVMQQARALPIEGQPGLGALSLPEDLNLLERHCTKLRVVWKHGAQARELSIRVPLLGAYVINKAVASRRRPGSSTQVGEKRSKDLHAAAAMLAERDRVSLEEGRLDVLGHVQDLVALIGEALE